MSQWVIGIIGGSGLYEIDGLEDTEEIHVETPWGMPSDHFVKGRAGTIELVFLPRHGKNHHLPPVSVPYRANIDAFKRLGCSDIVSISACGSLKEELAPGMCVMVDQFIDQTCMRKKSFFEPGLVAHVSMADPVCKRLSRLVGDAAHAAGGCVHRKGTYLAIDGPQFSTRAESDLYRRWGCDVIGMTNMPEARLAREAELPYATMAMVTDYDCWRETGEDVTVSSVLDVMADNTALAKSAIRKLALALQETRRTLSPQGIETCLDNAIVTSDLPRERRDLTRLDAVAGRIFKRENTIK